MCANDCAAGCAGTGARAGTGACAGTGARAGEEVGCLDDGASVDVAKLNCLFFFLCPEAENKRKYRFTKSRMIWLRIMQVQA